MDNSKQIQSLKSISKKLFKLLFFIMFPPPLIATAITLASLKYFPAATRIIGYIAIALCVLSLSVATIVVCIDKVINNKIWALRAEDENSTQKTKQDQNDKQMSKENAKITSITTVNTTTKTKTTTNKKQEPVKQTNYEKE